MHYRKMSKNYIFRKFECGLSKEETAKLCFKSVRTITGWDGGKEIPPECKRLMRLATGRKISWHDDWDGFEVRNKSLLLPTGRLISAQELLTGIALIEISSPRETETLHKLLKYARILNKIRQKRK
ncbi:phage protein [Vibrio fluvialis]|nr:phage protein [Vibrio fluvialis]